MLCAVTDQAGGMTSYTYDGGDRMLTITNPRGNAFVTNVYDTSGRVNKQTLADTTSKYTITYTTNGSGNITQASITDPTGSVRNETFDSAGYLATDTYAVGQSYSEEFQYTRDSSERLTKVVDQLGRETDYSYDSMANVLSFTRLAGTPQAVTTSLTYDPIFNQPLTITDPNNNTWTLGYYTYGNLTSVTDPLTHHLLLVTISRTS